jgi:uncharacterized protein with FMN-binding domain
MKKYLLSFFLVIAFVFYVILENQSSISITGNPTDSTGQAGAGAPSNPVAATPSAQPTATPAQTAQSPAPQPTTPAPTPAVASLYQDGTYNGDSVNAYFGNVQVAAVIAGGKLTNVNVLDYPKDRNTSARINNAALPKLVQEAISSQSASVDAVSGATQTSQGFAQSLASALAKAKS